MDKIMIIIAAVAGALLLAAAVYGAFRKFTRLTWIGWQVAMQFGLILLFGMIPMPQNGALSCVLSLGGAVLIALLPLLAEGGIRRLIFPDSAPSGGQRKLVRAVFNRLFGAVTAVLAVCALILVVGAPVLCVAETFTGPLLKTPVWTDLLSGMAADLLVCALLLVFIRAGSRLGFWKGLYALIMLLLTFGSFFGLYALLSATSWGISLSRAIGGWFSLPLLPAGIIGRAILCIIGFLLIGILLFLLSGVIGRWVRRMESHRVLDVIGKIAVGALFAAVLLAVVVAALYGLSVLEAVPLSERVLAALPQNIQGLDRVLPILQKADAPFTKIIGDLHASRLLRGLFENNPIRLIMEASKG